MHHFKAKGGTAVNFNSDLSGDAHVYLGPERAQSGHALIPCSDLLEIVDYWRREYHEEQDADGQLEEQLTGEERELALRRGRAFPQDAELLAKLLRIHDRLKARVAEEDAKARATAKRVAAEIEYDGPCNQCGRGYPG